MATCHIQLRDQLIWASKTHNFSSLHLLAHFSPGAADADISVHDDSSNLTVPCLLKPNRNRSIHINIITSLTHWYICERFFLGPLGSQLPLKATRRVL